MNSSRQRHAIVGTGSRSGMFCRALTDTYAATTELVAICDINPLRMAAWQAHHGTAVPTYAPADFETMIREQRVQTVIVTSIDRTHDDYICRAMEAGCDVISEKPMTIDAARCSRILRTQQATGRRLIVTFNYRYAPRNAKVREVLASGAIGDVQSVHFEWMLDTQHGADYFRRWHRDKANSGGLMVHKSTHHFDLVNWWLGTRPATVMAMGGLRFYGATNAAARGEPRTYARGTGEPAAAGDPFALDLAANEHLKKMYLECESADGYRRDQNVFGPGISIEDDLGVLVRYASGAVMTYHLVAYAPWEGYRVMFNGTKGRLEYDVTERAYTSGGDDDHNFVTNVIGGAAAPIKEPVSLLLRPHWQPAQLIEIPETNEGGHGGADGRMLADIFAPTGKPDPLGRAAGIIDGAYSILSGIAANQSLATGQPVTVAGLVPELR